MKDIWVNIYRELPKDWQDKMAEIFKAGGDMHEAFLNAGVSANDALLLMSGSIDFREFVVNGMSIAEAFWSKKLRDNISGKDVNIQIVKLVASRFSEWNKIIDKYYSCDINDDALKNRKERTKAFKNKLIAKGKNNA